MSPIDRRTFLSLGGASAAALLAACNSRGPEEAKAILRWAERRNEGVERVLFRHLAMDAPESRKLAGTALPSYYVSPTVPVWNEAARGAWTLEVTGLVRRPLRLTLPQLMRLPRITQRVNHYCVEGWTAVTQWTGVRVGDLARAAGVMPEAGYVDFQSFDSGYHESWDLESALHAQTLVAYGGDGGMLDPAYGAPARLHSPVKLGYKNVKYLTRIAFLPRRNGGYWSDQGYEWYAGT
ncbi:molybdopterin-dependent oxidoreductase [Longimicrobium sp.]|jgi:DMSO/TMAO reductase YedYZ molybdopterin-dependent catalytic subunit|uniref:molybdopterin-dependent oxidoreductase n=1 Tax=Longimicrobium sp. TaxID=2029185 RepID=UPI002ED7D63F